ncbi:methyltransferase family protein [Paraburkholderia sp.]|uniref:methyltransferase family protein n=1 Tax=Paraburkholderia sp. TaxID=1926495 RepID=UPI003D6FABF2
MLTRMIVQTFASLAVMGVLLFGGAGTVAWPAAWCFLIEVGALGLWVGFWLARVNPGLLAERLGSLVQKQQKPWDRLFMACAGLIWCAWLVLIALDARRFHGSSVPHSLAALGSLCILVSIVVTRFVFRANSYASPVVKLQSERGHKVADTGPYAYVRHPMYAGAIPFFVGTPLLLGSWWGLASVPLLVAALAVRAVFEERMLIEQLDGYADYASRVRYRLIPGIW